MNSYAISNSDDRRFVIALLPFCFALGVIFGGCAPAREATASQQSLAEKQTGKRTFVACLHPVSTHGSPDEKFLNELVDWARQAPDDVFPPDSAIVQHLASVLRPTSSLALRKAITLEAMRVLAGLESDWNWFARPQQDAAVTPDPAFAGAGVFQCSWAVLGTVPDLRDYVSKYIDPSDPQAFIDASQYNHRFAIEVCARVLSVSLKHHGGFSFTGVVSNPNPDWFVLSCVNGEAVAEFQRFIEE